MEYKSQPITGQETIMKPQDFIVSKTDLKGHITYCNPIFVEMSGWERHELVGTRHSIIRHPHMPKIAFKVLWDLIKKKKEFFGFVKNLRKDGGYYWVFAYATADINVKGNIVGYSSFRKVPSRKGIEAIEPIYQKLIDAETRGGVEASLSLLKEMLDADDNSVVNKYLELVFSLQKGSE